jgi:hypothetical protein
MHVDGGKGLIEGEHAKNDHQYGTHQRARRAVNMHSRDLPETDEDIGDDEDDKRSDHEMHFNMDREGISSISIISLQTGR